MNVSVYSLPVVASVPCQKATSTGPFGSSASHFARMSPPAAAAGLAASAGLAAAGAVVAAGAAAGAAGLLSAGLAASAGLAGAAVGAGGAAGAQAAARRATVAVPDNRRSERRLIFM